MNLCLKSKLLLSVFSFHMFVGDYSAWSSDDDNNAAALTLYELNQPAGKRAKASNYAFNLANQPNVFLENDLNENGKRLRDESLGPAVEGKGHPKMIEPEPVLEPWISSGVLFNPNSERAIKSDSCPFAHSDFSVLMKRCNNYEEFGLIEDLLFGLSTEKAKLIVSLADMIDFANLDHVNRQDIYFPSVIEDLSRLSEEELRSAIGWLKITKACKVFNDISCLETFLANLRLISDYPHKSPVAYKLLLECGVFCLKESISEFVYRMIEFANLSEERLQEYFVWKKTFFGDEFNLNHPGDVIGVRYFIDSEKLEKMREFYSHLFPSMTFDPKLDVKTDLQETKTHQFLRIIILADRFCWAPVNSYREAYNWMSSKGVLTRKLSVGEMGSALHIFILGGFLNASPNPKEMIHEFYSSSHPNLFMKHVKHLFEHTNKSDLHPTETFEARLLKQRAVFLDAAENWLINSGAKAKCTDVDQILKLYFKLSLYSPDKTRKFESFMKNNGLWQRCHDGLDLFTAMKLFDGELDIGFKSLLSAHKHGVLTNQLFHESFKKYPNILVDENFALPDYEYSEFLFLLVHGNYIKIPAVKAKIDAAMERDEERVIILRKLVHVLGEGHALTQEYLMLAQGYNNQQNPNGFLAVYQNMVNKSQEEAIHPLKTLTAGCVLNVDKIKEPRPKKHIHMPLNVWNGLFEKLKKEDKNQLDSVIRGLSFESMLELQQDTTLINLLDPLDSLKVNGNVSTHSQMLRMVLKDIQESQNIGSFLQLLVNITTCVTGKMNGITHSYIMMGQNQVLDESELGSEAFKMHIVSFFNEDLRRYRETCVSHVVQWLTKSRNPHYINYVRGVIGGEIGLLHTDEGPLIDFNGGNLNPNLRIKSKQQLLDLFYGYYSVEEVINRVHTKLNDGSISVVDDKEGRNLTASIISAYLGDDALSEDGMGFNQALVTLGEDGKVIGLTPEAAKLLLLQLGILQAV